MPRVNPLTNTQKIQHNIEKLTYETECQMIKHRIKKKDVAELTGVTASAVTQQFTNKHMTIDTFIAVQMLVEAREKK